MNILASGQSIVTNCMSGGAGGAGAVGAGRAVGADTGFTVRLDDVSWPEPGRGGGGGGRGGRGEMMI